MIKYKKSKHKNFIEQLNSLIDYYIKQRLQDIGENRCDFQVYELANGLCVSLSTFRRQCIKHTDRSPSVYIAEYRIEKAKKQLQHGVRSIDVARNLAFTEHKTFCTVFKRYQGETPSQYTQRHCK